MSRLYAFWCTFFILILHSMGFTVLRRSASSENLENAENVLDKIHINYDEYPLVVPKRPAVILDRLLVALQNALEDGDEQGVQRINRYYNKGSQQSRVQNLKLNKQFGKSDKNMLKQEIVDTIYDNEIPVDLDIRDLDQIRNSQSSDDNMDLQRRGHGEEFSANKGPKYWRCYFNAVTCF